MLNDRSSRDIHIADVAQVACVSVQTIYYHFDSLTQLLAQAQAIKYDRIVEPLHQFLVGAEIAVSNDDESNFWKAVGDDLMLAWSNSQGGDGWRVSEVLLDIQTDEKTKREFSKQLDVRFQRWLFVLDAAKARGWIDSDINTEVLIAVCWASANGPSIFAFSTLIQCTPEAARDFFLRVSMGTYSKRTKA